MPQECDKIILSIRITLCGMLRFICFEYSLFSVRDVLDAPKNFIIKYEESECMLKIFHMGDVHLDGAFGRFPRAERVKLRAHQREIFKKMIDYVARGRYDMLLITGDLFDGIAPTPECEECVASALSTLSCPVIISPGNHDPYALVSLYRKERLGENVYVFSSKEPQIFEFSELGALVCGYAFVESNELRYDPLADFQIPEFDGVKILCAHGEIGASGSKFAPLSEAEIASLGFTYAALGHVHMPSVTTRDGATIAYCGVSEGRGFDELGVGGAYSVTIDGELVDVERVPFGEYVYKIEELDVSEIGSEHELAERVEAIVSGVECAERTSLRILLTGEADAEVVSRAESVVNAAKAGLYHIELKDKSYPKIDLSSLAQDSTLRGEIYRTMLPQLESEIPEERCLAAKALKVALLAVDGRELGI